MKDNYIHEYDTISEIQLCIKIKSYRQGRMIPDIQNTRDKRFFDDGEKQEIEYDVFGVYHDHKGNRVEVLIPNNVLLCFDSWLADEAIEEMEELIEDNILDHKINLTKNWGL